MRRNDVLVAADSWDSTAGFPPSISADAAAYTGRPGHYWRTGPEIVNTVSLRNTDWRLTGESVSLQCLFTGRSGCKVDYQLLSTNVLQLLCCTLESIF